MRYILEVGYRGKQYRNKFSTTSNSEKGEPLITLRIIAKIFNLKDEKIEVKTDLDLLSLSSKEIESKYFLYEAWSELKSAEIGNRFFVYNSWKDLISKKVSWGKFEEVLEALINLHVDYNTIPLIFEILSDDLEIEVVDGEQTIIVTSDNLEKLKRLEKAFKKERDKRMFTNGGFNKFKVRLEEKR